MKPKGDFPHIRYLFDRQTHLRYRRLMKTLTNSLSFEQSDVAKYRLHVIEYVDKFGMKAALAAFNLKRSTVYLWRKRYLDSGKKLVSLVPRSTRPHSVRKMEVNWRLVEFIKSVRKQYGNVGARIIKPFLDEYAKSIGIPSIGRTTIEKVIRRRKFTFEKRRRVQRKLKLTKVTRIRKSPKVKKPGYIEIDLIEIRLWRHKYYFVSMIDVFTRYAYVELIPHKASQQVRDAFIRFQQQYHYSIHTVQTDNGSEFFKHFHQYLEEQQIKHIFIYPSSPKINGIVERFNRTIQEEFINRSVDFGIDQDRFQHQLANYLTWYNAKRPHSSLNYQSPLQFMEQYNQKSPISV